MCVRREKRSGFNAPALLAVGTNPGASTSILRVQGYRCNGRRRDGRCGANRGRISTCDLTRARYLPPLSLRGRRERFRSFTAEKRDRSPSYSIFSSSFFRSFLSAGIWSRGGLKRNIRLDYLRSSPTRSARKGYAYTKTRELFAGERNWNFADSSYRVRNR